MRRRRRSRRSLAGLFGRRRRKIDRRNKAAFKWARRYAGTKSLVSGFTSHVRGALRLRLLALRRPAQVASLFSSAPQCRLAFLRQRTRRTVSFRTKRHRVAARQKITSRAVAQRLDIRSLRLKRTENRTLSFYAATLPAIPKRRSQLRRKRQKKFMELKLKASIQQARRVQHQKWQFSAARLKLLTQHAVRKSTIRPRVAAGCLTTQNVIDTLLKNRTRALLNGRIRTRTPRFTRNSLLVPALLRSFEYKAVGAVFPQNLKLPVPAGVALLRRRFKRHPKRRLTNRRLNRKKRSKAPAGFLAKAAKVHSLAHRFFSRRKLTLQKRKYLELRFYHRRPHVRLGGTAITRRRRRYGGLVTFTRNSLRQPSTVLGQQQRLLPPINPYGALRRSYVSAHLLGRTTLNTYTHRRESLPIF